MVVVGLKNVKEMYPKPADLKIVRLMLDCLKRSSLFNQHDFEFFLYEFSTFLASLVDFILFPLQVIGGRVASHFSRGNISSIYSRCRRRMVLQS